mgnify:CR=1 FL=1
MKKTLTGLLFKTLTLSLLFFLSFHTGQAQKSEGVLGDLYKAKDGGLAHYSSEDPTGGNADKRFIAPGDKLVLVDHKGAGILRRWWITIAPRRSKEILRQLIVRCYWDGEEQPSVEVPVADFFGMGFGEWKDYISLPLNMTSGGYNAYWPMPFKQSARITVENTSTVPLESFYYNIDIRTYDQLDDDALYFHAQFRKARSKKGSPITILHTKGRGHYVGTLLSMQPSQGRHLGYLEGDEIIYIDGEQDASIVGTGTEDYFSSGWYYDTGEYNAPFHGISIKDVENGRINTYRWHIEDPVPFKEEFLFEIEHGGTNDTENVEYSSVAYWYQTHPHPPFPPLPEKLMPMAQVIDPSIEAESLIDKAKVTGGKLRVQDMESFEGNSWGNNAQLWWTLAKQGDELTLPLEIEEAGNYDLFGFFTRAGDYGIFQLELNGTPLGDLIDGYDDKVGNTGPVHFGNVPFKKGTNEITIQLVGKDIRSAGFSDGYLVGIDGFYISK